MKKLFYIRHAETVMNVAGFFSGQVETPLTSTGKLQAKLAGSKLKTKIPQIDLIICSPFSRAFDTAKIVAQEINYPVKKIVKNELFSERSFGVLDGTLGSDFMRNHTRKDLDTIESAETIEDLQIRAKKALEYVESLPQDNILIVSHGTFGRAFIRTLAGHPHTHEYLEEFRIGLDNAQIVELV